MIVACFTNCQHMSSTQAEDEMRETTNGENCLSIVSFFRTEKLIFNYFINRLGWFVTDGSKKNKKKSIMFLSVRYGSFSRNTPVFATFLHRVHPLLFFSSSTTRKITFRARQSRDSVWRFFISHLPITQRALFRFVTRNDVKKFPCSTSKSQD